MVPNDLSSNELMWNQFVHDKTAWQPKSTVLGFLPMYRAVPFFFFYFFSFPKPLVEEGKRCTQ
jgi:hypothetical protein